MALMRVLHCSASYEIVVGTIYVLYSIYDVDTGAEDSPRPTPGSKNGGRGVKRRQRN